MNKAKLIRIFLLLVLASGLLAGCGEKAPTLHAGLRASSYGIRPFPDPDWWVASAGDMASNFEGAKPAVIWIVAIMADHTHTWINFPKPEGMDDEFILSTNIEMNEVYLDRFEDMGVDVWLQVESGDADMLTLIDMVLTTYGDHPAVVGFGVDVEWYQIDTYPEGRAVTDEEAQAWAERVRSYDPNLRLFLKHWLPEKLPPTYREDILFVNDSQGHESFDDLVSYFSDWGQYFSPAPVGYQFGYLSDKPWWEELDDPPAEIGQALIDEVPNLQALFWVDFTARDIWPDE
jgi:hypothetical protein